jgi:hypothetical protein
MASNVLSKQRVVKDVEPRDITDSDLTGRNHSFAVGQCRDQEHRQRSLGSAGDRRAHRLRLHQVDEVQSRRVLVVGRAARHRHGAAADHRVDVRDDFVVVGRQQLDELGVLGDGVAVEHVGPAALHHPSGACSDQHQVDQ